MSGVRKIYGNMTKRDLAKLIHRLQDGRCFYCGEILPHDDITVREKDKGKRMLLPTIDHFIPKNKGGSYGVENIVIAHFGCNTAKSDRFPTEEEFQKFGTHFASVEALFVELDLPFIEGRSTRKYDYDELRKTGWKVPQDCEQDATEPSNPIAQKGHEKE